MRLSNFIPIVLLPLISSLEPEITVIGNFAVIANPESHVGTPNKTLLAQIPNLWCGVKNELGEFLDVEYGEFTRLSDGKVFPGTLNGGKVFMEIGKESVKAVGRYRCEVRTVDKEVHSGNSIIYLPPVLDFPKAVKVSEVLNARPPHVVGAERRGLHGERMVLECPVLGNPEPMVRWEKNGEPLGAADTIEYDGNNLILTSLAEETAGKYRCIGDNSFPLFVDGPAIPHQIFFDQDIKVL